MDRPGIGRAAASAVARGSGTRTGAAWGGLGRLARRIRNDIAVALDGRSPAGSREPLVILDDAFPHLLSGFRISEYNGYLRKFESSVVHTTASAISALGDRDYGRVLEEYERRYPEFRGRVARYNPRRPLTCGIAYSVFLNNAFAFIEYVERNAVPFVFTLYPGGGFRLDDGSSDGKLRRVLSSPVFRRVIVTQKISRAYLLDKGFCRPQDIEFLYGGVFPSDRLGSETPARRRYGKEKGTIDICFVAHKYAEKGVDKGYDVFVEVAKRMLKTGSDIRWHVVGPFGPTDINVTECGDRIRFYGLRGPDFFPEFYSRMDIILSPNAPFVLAPGAFDGFPTGCCIEAGLCGVAVFCTDPLAQNIALRNGEEVVIVARDADAISGTIGGFLRDIDSLYELSDRGRRAFLRVFDMEAQLAARFRILEECMGDDRSSSGHLSADADPGGSGRARGDAG